MARKAMKRSSRKKYSRRRRGAGLLDKLRSYTPVGLLGQLFGITPRHMRENQQKLKALEQKYGLKTFTPRRTYEV